MRGARGTKRALALAFQVAILAPSCRTREPRIGGSEPLVCPHDASARGGVCQCARGLTALEGACVGAGETDAYCAPFVSRGGGCVAATCSAPGEPLDLATGTCASIQTARAIAARARPIPDDLALGCPEGRTLVVRADDVACVPFDDACPRSSAWDTASARCLPGGPCSPGDVRSGEQGQGACVRVVTHVSEGEAVVDVGRWSRAMIGSDGGDGTARLCRPLAQSLLGEDGPGGARTLGLTVTLQFPDNDVTQVSAEVQVLDAASGEAIGPSSRQGGRQVAQAAESAVAALLVPLRALGGASDAASTRARVRCTIHGGGSPRLFPR